MERQSKTSAIKSIIEPHLQTAIKAVLDAGKIMIQGVVYKINIESLNRDNDIKDLKMNDICRVKIRTTKPLMVDSYRENRTTSNIILIDDATFKLLRLE